MLETAEEQTKRWKTQQSRLMPLHDRMEKAYHLWRSKIYQIDKEEGEWESLTTNSPEVLSNSISERIAHGDRTLSILVTDESEEERKKLTETERFVNAALQLNDSIRMANPEDLLLQAMMGWTSSVCGFVIPRVYLFKEKGEFFCDVQAWDPRHVFWIPGKRGPAWVCNERWASIDELKDTYGNDVESKCKPDPEGRVHILDAWDRDEEGILAAESHDFIDKQKHKLNHPPVLILPVGTSPYVQRDQTPDTIAYLGSDVFINNRELYEKSSRLRSMRMTLASLAAKRPFVLKYDSTKGGQAPTIKGDPGAAGSYVVLDVGVGQDIEDRLVKEMTQDANILQAEIEAELSMGGAAPIAYGQINQALPYGGISLLTDSSMQRMKPAHEACERALEWVANEIVTQFKSGNFGEVTLRGSEASHRSYNVKLSPEDINDEWPFTCQINLSLPKDEQIEIAVATQEVTTGLLSKREAREKHQLSKDLDHTEMLVLDEKLDDVLGLGMRKYARWLAEVEGDREAAQDILDQIEERNGQREQERGVAVQPGIPIPAPPMAGFASRTTPPGRTGTRQVRQF